MVKKTGGAAVPLSQGELGSHLTEYGLKRGLLPYQVTSSSIQLFGHNRHGQKTGCVPLLGGSPTPSNTTSPWHRFTSVPSRILIHPALWPQQARGKNWVGAVSFFSGGAGSPSNTKLPGLRPTSIPNNILVPPLFGHNGHCRKLGDVPL